MTDPCPIRFCALNPRSNEERDTLLAAGCEQRDCLGQCSLCFETRFLVADTMTIEGEEYPEIIRQARAWCAEHPPHPAPAARG